MGTVLLIFTCSTLPVLGWLWYFYYQDPHPESTKTLFKAFFAGMKSVLPVLVLHQLFKPLGITNFFSIVILTPIIEEYCKYLFVRKKLHNDSAFDEPIDGIIYATTGALGFAMVENVFYIINAWFSGNIASVSLLRAIITVPGHALFASMWGYARSVEKFSDLLVHKKETNFYLQIKNITNKISSYFPFQQSIKNHLYSSSFFSSFLIHSGIWLAILMHMGLNRSTSLGTIATGIMVCVMLVLDIFFRHISKKKLHQIFFLPQNTLIHLKNTKQEKPIIYRSPIVYTHPSSYDKKITNMRKQRQEYFLKQGKKIRNGNIIRLAGYNQKTNTYHFEMTTFKTVLTYRSLVYDNWELSQYPPNNIYFGTFIQTRNNKWLMCKTKPTSTSYEFLNYKIPGGLRKVKTIPKKITRHTIKKTAFKEAINDVGTKILEYLTFKSLFLLHTSWGEYMRIRYCKTKKQIQQALIKSDIALFDFQTLTMQLAKQKYPGYKTIGEIITSHYTKIQKNQNKNKVLH